MYRAKCDQQPPFSLRQRIFVDPPPAGDRSPGPQHMDLHSVSNPNGSKLHFDLAKIFPPARKKTAKSKLYCNSIPAIVGPWRGMVRAWHAPDAPGQDVPAPDLAARREIRKSEHLSCGTSVSLEQTVALVIERVQTVPQLRSALRRERQLGIAGHPSYSVARHHDLYAALIAAADASALALQSAKRNKANATRPVGGRRSRPASRTALH
jgi:hypothetical protein